MRTSGAAGPSLGRREAIRLGLTASAGAVATWALSACGPLARPTAAKPGILLVWEPWRVGWGNGWSDIFHQFTEPFRKEHPGLDIKVSAPSAWANDTQVATEIMGGSGPDVFAGYSPAPLVEGGLVLNLKPYITKYEVDLSQFDAGQLAHFVTSDGIFGLPAELSTTAVLVNQGAIDAQGLERPSPNWTAQEAATLWQGMSRGGTTPRWGHAVWMSIAADLPGNYLWRSWGANFAAHNFSDTCTLDSKEALDFANWFYPQVQSGIIALQGAPQTDFLAGTLTTATFGSWLLPWAAMNLQGMNWDVYPTPAGPAGSTSYAGRDYYAVNVRTKYPEEAAAFLIWLTTSKVWLTSLVQLLLVVPPLRPYWSTWVDAVRKVAPPLVGKNLEAFVQPALQGKAFAHPAFKYQSESAYTIIGTYMQQIVNQTMTPADALPKAADQVNRFEQVMAKEAVTLTTTANLLQQAQASKTAISFPKPSPAGIGVPDSTPPTGAITSSGGTWTLVGDGSDVWTTSDNCTFACTAATLSQARYTCRLTSLVNLDCPHLSPWAKVGLMVRQDLSDDAMMLALVASGGNGVFVDIRPRPGSTVAQQNPTSPTAKVGLIGAQVLTLPQDPSKPHQNRLAHPIWLRLERENATWTTLTSADGQNWAQAGNPMTLQMASGYVGLFALAHNSDFGGQGRIRATFDSLDFTPTLQVQLGVPGKP